MSWNVPFSGAHPQMRPSSDSQSLDNFDAITLVGVALVRLDSPDYDRGMEQRRVRFPLGALSSVEAETYGEPGKRTFRLVLSSGAARSYVWLEKEQLFQLGRYLQEAVKALVEANRDQDSQPAEPPWSGGETSIEFKAAQMSLGFDAPSNSFFLQAYESDQDSADEESASISCWVTVGQARPLAEEALRICASGRPPCFLCGRPIDPEGHVCPRANGHAVFESG